MLAQNAMEGFYRWCRNIQALTVFPITKNGRLLIAGMAGHRGSVYGYKYGKGAIDNSIQGIVMNFLKGTTDTNTIADPTINFVGKVFGYILCDANYEKISQKWINNLGLDTSDDIVKALSEMDSVAGMISKDVFDKTAGELAEAKRKAKEKMIFEN